MKSKYVLFLGLMSFTVTMWARDPAQVRFYCTSVQLLPANGGPGQAETFEVTTDSTLGEINNEVNASTDVPVYFQLDDPTSAGTVAGQIIIPFPAPVDANGNGFDDFYESSQAVPPTNTQGAFQIPGVDSGTVAVSWSRDAGSTVGTCRLQMTGKVFGQLPAFIHTFQLLEYNGTLTYVPATNLITGTLHLLQNGGASNSLTGPVSFTRVSTNRFNQLELQPGTLTNAAGQTLSFQSSEIDRDQVMKTNYFGYVIFADGDPTTSTLDYQGWVISIDDPNDANGNGIPDLSDDPGSSSEVVVRLGLVRSGGQLLLSMSGVTGNTYELQEASTLSSADWAKSGSVTLTNNPQVISLPPPATATRFWRARVP
jgi:hypothetical protein